MVGTKISFIARNIMKSTVHRFSSILIAYGGVFFSTNVNEMPTAQKVSAFVKFTPNDVRPDQSR